jgi:Cytochrome C oxidase subunit II, transmembrane domain
VPGTGKARRGCRFVHIADSYSALSILPVVPLFEGIILSRTAQRIDGAHSSLILRRATPVRLVPSPFVIPGGRPSVAATARDHRHIRRRTTDDGWKRAILRQVGCCVATALSCAPWAVGDTPQPQIPSIFKPESTPAESVYNLSLFVLVCAVIFIIVFFLIVYAGMKFRLRRQDDGSEPPQVYGSNRVELAWTVIPVLIVVVLFLATARVIHAVQDAQKVPGTVVIA